MAEPINTVFKATPDNISILTSSGSGIHLDLPFEGDIEHNEDEQTHNQTFNIPNESLTIKLDDNNGIHTVDIKKEENGITVIYHETISNEVREGIEVILNELINNELADEPFEVGDIVDGEHIFLTAITHENDILKFVTTDGNGFSMTFKKGEAVPAIEGVFVEYNIVKDGVKIGEIEISDTDVDVRLYIVDDAAHIFKINYIEGITEELKADLIAILNAPAAVGGRRRRHRKTKRRLSKKKRTRKAKK